MTANANIAIALPDKKTISSRPAGTARLHIPIKVRSRDFCEKRKETDDRGKRLIEDGNDVERYPKFAQRPASRW